MRTPQRYANRVASTIERDLEAPVLIVTRYGIGVSGNGLRNGVRGGSGRDGLLWALPALVIPFALLAGYRRSRSSPAASEAC